MKKIIFIILLGALLCGCGISSKDKEYMQTVLHNELVAKYREAGHQIMFLNVTLDKVYKSSYIGTSSEYSGYFKCTFTDNDKEITFYGDVGFDKNLQISKVSQIFGDNKIAVSIFGPYIVGTKFELSLPPDSKYILDCFMNRNKVAGNE